MSWRQDETLLVRKAADRAGAFRSRDRPVPDAWRSRGDPWQGITSAALHGTVRGEPGSDVDGASVRVINNSTGYATETRVRAGGFLVQGLATGGPYRIVVTKVGYAPQVVDRLFLSLGEELKLRVTLVALATELDTVRVSGNDDGVKLPSAGGVGTSISDSSLRRLPTLNL